MAFFNIGGNLDSKSLRNLDAWLVELELRDPTRPISRSGVLRFLLRRTRPPKRAREELKRRLADPAAWEAHVKAQGRAVRQRAMDRMAARRLAKAANGQR